LVAQPGLDVVKIQQVDQGATRQTPMGDRRNPANADRRTEIGTLEGSETAELVFLITEWRPHPGHRATFLPHVGLQNQG
jgi:hypothetical protein